MGGEVDQAVIAAAREMVIGMRSAAAKLQPGGTVRMSGKHFVQLARLVDHLCDHSRQSAAGRFDAPIDGICWWVPLPEYQRVLAQLDASRTA